MKHFILSILISSFWLIGASQHLDINLLKEINVNRTTSLDQAFIFTSNSVTPISILIPTAIYLAGVINKDCTGKQKGIYIGETLVVATIISTSLKYAVHRDRPFETYSYIQQVVHAGSLSFPSGHTSVAFSTATSLSIAYSKWYVIAPSFAWAGLVGYSRMHLGVHYPSDVFAGALVGAGSAFIMYKVNKWMQEKKKR